MTIGGHDSGFVGFPLGATTAGGTTGGIAGVPVAGLTYPLAMSLSVEMITFDCSDPDALGSWWSEAVGGTVNAVAPGEFVVVLREVGPRLGFQRVDKPTPGKNRV